MLMIACSASGWSWYWAEGSHNGPKPKAESHYGCPKVNTKAIPLQATINLFINWLLDFTLIPRFNQAIIGFTKAIMDFTRPLWVSHYGLCFTCHKT